jgi:hypothetical protein
MNSLFVNRQGSNNSTNKVKSVVKVRVISEQQVNFDEFPDLARQIWFNIKTKRHYRIVGVFNGLDGNRWVGLIGVPDINDRHLLLHSQFIKRFMMKV